VTHRRRLTPERRSYLERRAEELRVEGNRRQLSPHQIVDQVAAEFPEASLLCIYRLAYGWPQRTVLEGLDRRYSEEHQTAPELLPKTLSEYEDGRVPRVGRQRQLARLFCTTRARLGFPVSSGEIDEDFKALSSEVEWHSGEASTTSAAGVSIGPSSSPFTSSPVAECHSQGRPPLSSTQPPQAGSLPTMVLDYVEREALRLAFDFWKVPEVTLFGRIDDTYHMADALLSSASRLRDQIRLYHATAQLAVMRGKVEAFNDRHAAAEEWYTIGKERALEVGDSDLAVWSLVYIAAGRSYAGTARQVLESIEEGRSLASRQATAAHARLAMLEGRARGLLGDIDGVHLALRDAEQLLSQCPTAELEPSIFGCNHAIRMKDAAVALVHTVRAIGKGNRSWMCQLALEAEQAARTAISLYRPEHFADLDAVRMYLGIALAMQDRPDEGCAMARSALDRSPELRASYVRRAAGEFEAVIAPYGDLREIRDLQHLLHSV
jgi:hypothetical protein